MRVVLLGPFPPPHGGVETNVVAIRNFLRKEGHSCAVLNITRHRKQEADHVFYPRNAPELLQHLYTRRYDVVHLHVGGELPRRVLLLGLACNRVPWATSVFTFHSGGYPSTPAGRAAQPRSLAGFVLRRFDGLIGVNQEILDFFARLGVSRNRMRLILPHSVASAPMEDTLPPALAAFYASHDPVLLGACLLKPEYQAERQVEALGQVRQRYPRAGLVILGSGILEEALRAQVARCGYGEHIFMTGDLAHEYTLRAIADSSVVLRTTLYDGDAISVREALHLGTPVIATDNGMRPPGVHLVPVADTEALVRAIVDVVDSPRERSNTAANDTENLAQVLQFYQELRNGRR